MLVPLTVSVWLFDQIKKNMKNKWTKTNRKLKTQYKCIKANIPVPYGSMGCTYHQLKYSSPNRSNKANQERHKRAYLSENWGLGKKKSEEWAKSTKRSDRKSERTRQKNKRGDKEKRDKTDSPEIPDRGETPTAFLRTVIFNTVLEHHTGFK